LTHRGVFPEHLLDKFITTKMRDITDMQKVPHPWEIARYYDI
jgi:glutamine synthetase